MSFYKRVNKNKRRAIKNTSSNPLKRTVRKILIDFFLKSQKIIPTIRHDIIFKNLPVNKKQTVSQK